MYKNIADRGDLTYCQRFTERTRAYPDVDCSTIFLFPFPS